MFLFPTFCLGLRGGRKDKTGKRREGATGEEVDGIRNKDRKGPESLG